MKKKLKCPECNKVLGGQGSIIAISTCSQSAKLSEDGKKLEDFDNIEVFHTESVECGKCGADITGLLGEEGIDIQ